MPITSAEAAAYAEAQRWCDLLSIPSGVLLMPERVNNPKRHHFGIFLSLFNATDPPPEDYLTSASPHQSWVKGYAWGSISIGRSGNESPKPEHVRATLETAYGELARERFELIQDICQQIQELIAKDENEQLATDKSSNSGSESHGLQNGEEPYPV
jgi:hypothetical protein